MERDLLDWIGIVPLLPLIGAAVLLLFGRRIGEPLAGWIADRPHGPRVPLVARDARRDPQPPRGRAIGHRASPSPGCQVDQLQVDFGFLADPLSITWILLVTGVGSLIFLYSIGYMHGDPNFGRFFAYISLFAGSMLLLVTGSNYLLTFLGWEGVGLCSYLLIAFWFERSTAAQGGEEGVHHQPRRRRRVPDRDVHPHRRVRHARLRRDREPRRRAPRARSSPRSRSCSCSRRSGRAPRSRSSPG